VKGKIEICKPDPIVCSSTQAEPEACQLPLLPDDWAEHSLFFV
jgi:hypothetical protein